ncbi:MAG: hypothetical protein FWE88_05090 [Phycisphaerae bacterium]|nr:hypothetical protein [Phycisphaerae bacterium]
MNFAFRMFPLVAAMTFASWAWAQRVDNTRPSPIRSTPTQQLPPLPKPTPTTRPATTQPANPAAALTPADQELLRMVQLEVAQQMQQIRTGRARQRDRAQAAILQLHRQLLLPLDAAHGKTLATRDYRNLLATWAREVRLARLGVELGAEPMARIRKLQTAKPNIFELLISDDPAAMNVGFNTLRGWSDPDKLAEPLVTRALRNSRPEYMDQLLAVYQLNRYLTPATLDGLLEIYHGQSAPRRPGQTPQQAANALANLRQQILPLLCKFEDDRIPPILLHAVMEYRHIYQTAPLIEGLVKNKAHGAIDVLMSATGRGSAGAVQGKIGAQTVTYVTDDTLLYAVLKLTGQSPDLYGLKVQNYQGRISMIGFTDDESRKAAMEMLRLWWDGQRDQPPYNDAPPVTPQPPMAQR